MVSGERGYRDDVFHVAVLGLVIVAVVLGIRWLISQGKQSPSDSALEILRQEEFEAKKRDLI